MKQAAPGIKTFGAILSGQVLSLLGSGLTSFALHVWLYEETGSLTRYNFLAIAGTLPGIVLSPIAGVLVDRWDRRLVMILSDAAAALTTLVLLLLVLTERLAPWHVYLIVASITGFCSVQMPAFLATVTLLVPKRHYGRAAGFQQLGESGAQVLTPLLAGSLFGWLQVQGLVAIDLTTFVLSAAILLTVRLPRPKTSATGVAAAGGPILGEIGYAWRWICRRPGLLRLLVLFSLANFFVAPAYLMATPLILSFASAREVGYTLTVSALGVVAGSLVMSAWGGPANKVHGVLAVAPLWGLALIVCALRPSVWLISAAYFVISFCIPVVNGCAQAIWQVKVEPDLQGRIFGLRRMIGQLSTPLALLLIGPFSDYVCAPLLAPGTSTAAILSPLCGAGSERGIALMFFLLGLAFLLVMSFFVADPRLRRLEDDLPDAVS